MKKVAITLVLVSFCFATQAFAFWIWTPKDKKWVNPKYAVKHSPQKQFEYAMEFFDEAQFERAIREFKQLIQRYPKSQEAAEAQYYIGRCFQEWIDKDIQEQKMACEKSPKANCRVVEKLWYRARYYQAYKNYQMAIDRYAFTKRFEEIIEREYEIAEWFISGSTKKILGMTFELEDPVIEILRKVVENAPYGKVAPKALYRLGLYLKGKGYYLEAQKEFEKVVNNYPESQWILAARYQIAVCIATISPKAAYDQHLTTQARKKFQEFVKSHPEAELSKDAQKKIEDLREKEANSNFDIAVFYERQKQYESAKIYYGYVINNYPNTKWASKAQEALGRLEIKE